MNGLTMIVVAVVAFAVSALLGKKLIPFLHKLKFGQTIKEVGPTWHQAKQGTPVMGGLLFIIGLVVAVIVGVVIELLSGTKFEVGELLKLASGTFMALGFGFVGFVDDYIKVVKRRNLGLRARTKIVMQILITTAYLATLSLSGTLSTLVRIPFVGQVDFGWIYYPFMAILIIGVVNAVNLTDGIDGLAGSVTFVYGIAFMIIGSLLHLMGVSLFAVALAASCLGFLIWNFHPAKVFMGDTGSMFLGGAVVALAFNAGWPLLLFLAGFLYCFEALSVILQVISFKTTGKRIFKMSPIHHHFEMCGWSEVKIVMVFSAVMLVMCGISIAAVMMM